MNKLSQIKQLAIYLIAFVVLTAWAGAIVGILLFILEGDRFTASDGKLLEMRIQALEKVQTEPLPVMAWVKQKQPLVRSGDKVTGNFYALKQRPCDRVPASEAGLFSDADGVNYESAFGYIADTSPASTFASSVVFDIGGAEWTGVPQEATKVGWSMFHTCGDKPERSEFWFDLPAQAVPTP